MSYIVVSCILALSILCKKKLQDVVNMRDFLQKSLKYCFLDAQEPHLKKNRSIAANANLNLAKVCEVEWHRSVSSMEPCISVKWHWRHLLSSFNLMKKYGSKYVLKPSWNDSFWLIIPSPKFWNQIQFTNCATLWIFFILSNACCLLGVIDALKVPLSFYMYENLN